MEHSVYLTGIKNALRTKGITYADLSKQLKMTESGVKKMLTAKDISFRRVLQICEVLDVLPGQLFSLSEKISIPVVRLSDTQQEALIGNRHLLMIYWRFTIEKLNIDEISRLHHLKDAELKKALQKLLNLDLIVQRRGLFFPKHHGKFRWSDDSKLARLLNQEWSQLTLKKALKRDNGQTHSLIAMKLSKKSYTSLLNRLSILFDEAIQTSEREELTASRQDLLDVTALFAAVDEGVFTV